MDDTESSPDNTMLSVDPGEVDDERTLLARQRTDASASRTVLANERTFSAWLRTALSGIGLGLAVPKLLASPTSHYVATWLGLLLIVLGVIAGMLAAKLPYLIDREHLVHGTESLPEYEVAIRLRRDPGSQVPVGPEDYLPAGRDGPYHFQRVG